ncbi:nSTAND1 domain-containing NTPase [Geodermatophilus sp. URMC 62]|uniref:nSTAND1 domain-containing NTPase n=1 Tax=Geodermatophilus sp. URMC 62 TaxID=3423414 RepID=UPI00406D04B0
MPEVSMKPDSVDGTDRPQEEVTPSAQETSGRFDVFLSYNSRDRRAVERVARHLKRMGFEPWFDRWSLTPGGEWQDEMAEGMGQSSACAVFIGPHDVGEWERLEFALALSRAAHERGFRVFPVLLPGLDPFDPATLPPFLAVRTWVDLRGGPDSDRGLQDLAKALRGLPFGAVDVVESDTAPCPYRGLNVFEEEHARFYFGREAQVQRLLERLKQHRFVAVVGPSGSGKSSLVRAGLLPRLRAGKVPGSETWPIHVMRPGGHPVAALAGKVVELAPSLGLQATADALATDERALHLAVTAAFADAPHDRHALIVVDQCEELFTLCRDDRQRSAFLQVLHYASAIPGGRTAVVLTLRADFYSRLAAHPGIAQLAGSSQMLIGGMSEEELRQVVEEPAREAGLDIEPGLVETILTDVVRVPGSLPLLEHALLETWRRRRGGMLTLQGYRDTGGVQRGLADRAEALYAELPLQCQEVARHLLLRLTQPGEGTEDTRRRVSMREVSTGPGADLVEDVVGRLVDARLLSSDADADADADGPDNERWIEVSHEALIRGWPRLQGWIDEDRAGLRIHRNLTASAQEWERLGRDDGVLYRGGRLVEAVEWEERAPRRLNELEREFLEGSRRAEQASRRARRRRLQAMFAALLVALTAISVVAVVAVNQEQEASRQKNRAEEERQVATSRFLSAAAINSLDRHLDRAALLSVEASAIQDTAESRHALLTTVQRTPDAQRYLRSEGAEVADVAISPDGTVVAAVDHDGFVAVWDMRSGRALAPPTVAHDGHAIAVAFSPDGRLVATGGGDGTLAIWDAASLTLVRRLDVVDPAVRSLAFSPDGRWLAAGGGAPTSLDSLFDWNEGIPRQIEMFDASTWTHTRSLTGHVGAIENLRFSANSGRIYSAGIDFDSGMAWWDTATWEAQWISFPEQPGTNEGVGFSPDGSQVAVAKSRLSDEVLVWDVQKNQAAATLTGLTGGLSGVAYSPTGDFIAASTYDGEVGIWATADLTQPVRRLASHDRNIEGGGTVVTFGPSGLLVSGSSDGAVILHDLNVTTRLVTDVLSGTDDIAGGDVVGNERGLFAFTSSDSPVVQLWDARTDELRSIPRPADASLWTGSALSRDGTRMTVDIMKDDEHALALIDTQTGRELWRDDGAAIGAAFSPDGSVIAIADDTGEVGLVDAETGSRRATFPDQPPVPEELERYAELDLTYWDEAVMAFDGDGSTLAVAGPDGPVWLWDVERQELASDEPLLGHGRVASMAFSPDGDILATGGVDEQVRLWNVESGNLIGLTSERPQGRVYTLLFSPDGRILASSSPEHEFWDVESRQRIGEPIDVSDPWSQMAFSVDGGELVIVGPRGEVKRVDTSIQSWIDIACIIANRDLSADEAQQFLDGQDTQSCGR